MGVSMIYEDLPVFYEAIRASSTLIFIGAIAIFYIGMAIFSNEK
jgi:hypothetical protein